MHFTQHYSGSTANLYEITASNGKRLLIECGVSWKKIRRALGSNLEGTEGCFVSHSHKDHCCAMREVLENQIDVFASEETLMSMHCRGNRKAKAVHKNDLVRRKSFDVLCFETQHDCPGSLGFVVYEKATKEYLLFATDTKCIEQRFKYPFSIIAIEASYDKDVLAYKVKEGIINEELAKRLLTSHQEIKEALRYITTFCDKTKLHEVHLLHMSGVNSDKDKAKELFEKELMFVDVVYCEDR